MDLGKIVLSQRAPIAILDLVAKGARLHCLAFQKRRNGDLSETPWSSQPGCPAVSAIRIVPPI